jgi:hypothetical protein
MQLVVFCFRFPKHGEVILDGARKRLVEMLDSCSFVCQVVKHVENLRKLSADAACPQMLATIETINTWYFSLSDVQLEDLKNIAKEADRADLLKRLHCCNILCLTSVISDWCAFFGVSGEPEEVATSLKKDAPVRCLVWFSCLPHGALRHLRAVTSRPSSNVRRRGKGTQQVLTSKDTQTHHLDFVDRALRLECNVRNVSFLDAEAC